MSLIPEEENHEVYCKDCDSFYVENWTHCKCERKTRNIDLTKVMKVVEEKIASDKQHHRPDSDAMHVGNPGDPKEYVASEKDLLRQKKEREMAILRHKALLGSRLPKKEYKKPKKAPPECNKAADEVSQSQDVDKALNRLSLKWFGK